MPVESRYCSKCKRTMDVDQFYGTNNVEKYPDGKLQQCKKCTTMHVNNFEPDTYLWILQECDVPYIPEEWNKLLATYGKNKSSMTGTTILGRYLSKMKLKQFRDYRWKDNEFLQEVANAKMKTAMERQGYDVQEITKALATAFIPMPQAPLEIPTTNLDETVYEQSEDYFEQRSGSTQDFNDNLTDEDRTYLRLKWGKTYKPEEWIRLEQLYEEMMASYDVQGAGHIDTLKLVCKTSLKANQLIDIGDIEGFQKMSKVYNDLMKSGKFTAAQNKGEAGDFIDSIGELVELCEKQGYIERYYIESPKDKVDLTISDMQRYTRTLIEEETNLPVMVEKALREIDKEDKNHSDDEDITDDVDISLEELEASITDNDYEDFSNFIEQESAADEEYLLGVDV